MTPEDFYGALQAIAAGISDYHEPKWNKGPWLMSHEGKEMAVATDAHVLIAVPRDAVIGELSAPPANATPLMERFSQTAQGQQCRGADLKQFAGYLPPLTVCARCEDTRKVKCEDCEGVGYEDCECSSCGDSHQAQCETCDGDGMESCPECSPEGAELPATFVGLIVNRRKLGAVLAAVQPSDDAAISVSADVQSQHSQTVILRGDGWMAMVAAMAKHVKPLAHFDRPETWATSTVGR